jgi:hypothetical protein
MVTALVAVVDVVRKNLAKLLRRSKCQPPLKNLLQQQKLP